MRSRQQWLAVVLAVAAPLAAQSPAEAPAPEEPDFFFLAGGPYTQLRNSFQIIWANQFVRDRSGAVRTRDFIGAGRFEWGFSDRFEFDLEFGYLRPRASTGGVASVSAQGVDDTMLGARYRLLREPSFPVTLTTGPQIILPSASRRQGLGTGKTSYAWDLALARDFGGPFFLGASLNASVTPDVADLAPGSSQRFDLSGIEWGVAFLLRPLERDTSAGSHHDIHLYLEFGGGRFEEIDAGGRTRRTEVLAAPGIRYGFLTAGKTLTEIGFSVPLGLTRNAPDWGLILQVQFEAVF